MSSLRGLLLSILQLYKQIHWYFLLKKWECYCTAKASHIFSTKNIGIFEILTFEILTSVLKKQGHVVLMFKVWLKLSEHKIIELADTWADDTHACPELVHVVPCFFRKRHIAWLLIVLGQTVWRAFILLHKVAMSHWSGFIDQHRFVTDLTCRWLAASIDQSIALKKPITGTSAQQVIQQLSLSYIATYTSCSTSASTAISLFLYIFIGYFM